MKQTHTSMLDAPRSKVALIYCRVSTRNQEQEGTSLESQADACVKHAESLGYTVGRVTREVFSGAELWDRPLLARDRADLKNGDYQALIAYSTDRLSRDPIHLAIIAEECGRAGIELVFVTDVLDGSAESMLIQYVKGYASKIEREKIRERSLRGKKYRLQSGKLHRTSTDLYGYRRVDDAARREVLDTEAVIVRKIYEWFTVDRLSLRGIERRLNEQGIKPPAWGKRKSYVRGSVSGQTWNHTAIRNILRDPSYKGETILWRWQLDGKAMKVRPEEEWVRLPDGTTPAIVAAEVWDEAQHRLADNRGRSIATRNEYRPCLLRGLVTCGACGKPMRPNITKEGRFTYRCSSREHGKLPCAGTPVRADDVVPVNERPRDKGGRMLPLTSEMKAKATVPGIETWAWNQVAQMLRDPSIIAREIERRDQEGPDPVLASDLETARRALGRIERQQEKLLQQFSQAEDDDFPWELVKAHVSRLEKDKEHHERAIEDLELRLSAEAHTHAQLASLTAYCERVSRNLDSFGFEERRLALEALNVRIVATGRTWSMTGTFPVGVESTEAISSVVERAS